MSADANNCGSSFQLTLLHPRFWLTWFGIMGVFLLSWMPHQVRHLLGRSIGNIIYAKNKKRRQVVNENIKIAFPDLSSEEQQQYVKEHLQWYGCALIDYSLLLFASKRRLSKFIEIKGRVHLDTAIKNQQSVIILLAHSVMLEFAPIALGLNYNCYGSYKSAKNPVMDWLIAKSRCRFVTFVVSREQGLRRVVRELVHNQLLIFLPDEDLGLNNAVFAPFFGKQKATLTTPARIATLGKAVGLPCFAYFDQRTKKYNIVIAPAIENYPSGDATQNATLLNQQLEKLIQQQPTQYMWLMKWYRTRPKGEKGVYSD